MVSCTVARRAAAGVGALVVIASACGGDSPTKPSPVPEPLTVKSVDPNAGPTEGRVTVGIVGTGFRQGLTVGLDGPATNILLTGSTVIWATVPAHAEGAVDVVVTNPDGQSARLEKAYTYAPMAVTKIQPAVGTIGRWIRFDGFGFLPDATVTFDGTAATRVVRESQSSIYAVAPPHTEGTVDVTVTNPGGRGLTLAGAYTYRSVTLTATPAVVGIGGQLIVAWSSPAFGTADWIGLFRLGDPNGAYISYEYVSAATGSRTFTAPPLAGQYEFRYLVDDDYYDAARSAPITVTAAGAPGTARGASTLFQ
jgi:IPT/TIG domain-containing protein